MIKIDVLSVLKLSFHVVVLPVFLSFQIQAQDSISLQKAMQSCLEHRKVQPYLDAVSFEKNQDVLVVENNKFIPNDLKLFMFGKEVLFLEKQALFFYGIEQYVSLKEVKTEKKKITLRFTTGAQFTCTYLPDQNKIKKLDRIDLE